MGRRKETKTDRLARAYLGKLAVERGESSEAKEADILEIGMRKFRLYDRVVRVLRWGDKGKTIVVKVDGKVSRYLYPVKIYYAFREFEVLDDCGYTERFSNCDVCEFKEIEGRVVIKDGRVWAIGGHYLSSSERLSVGPSDALFEKLELVSKKRGFI